jgi:two-component system sensor histidine kinase ArlS
MSKKLLYKTQKTYLIFSVIMFVVVAIFFYFITERLYLQDTDETLTHRKLEFIQNTISELKTTDIELWNKYNRNIKIIDIKSVKKDTFFYSSYFDNLEQENEKYRELNSPIIIEGKPYTFSARIKLVENEDFIISISILFAVITFLLLLGLIIITKKMSINLWKPFHDTLQQIERFEIDKSKQPQFLDTEIEEFNRLNLSIAKLIGKNKIIFDSQCEFVENAAHELQTPIAIFQAKLDTLIQRSDITQEQSELLSSLIDSVSRLNRLNKNLLLLSKIDFNHFTNTEIFSMKELIEKQLDFFKEQAEQKNIKLNTSFQNDFTIKANIGLTEILLNNLFLNAIRHNVKNGKLNISLSEQNLAITNTGTTEQLIQEKLFIRFSKSSASEQGNGLGLAIVKKIADLNGWTVLYTFSNNLHSFSVKF